MPEFEGGQRERARGLHHDVESRARERVRELAKETPEPAAAKRVEQLWHAADSTAQRAAKLSAIAWRKEWRAERNELKVKQQGLKEELMVRAADAEVSERARARYDEATAKVAAIAEELERAKEPRPVPPVRDEVELEPSIEARRAGPGQLLAWVAGLSERERRALVERIGGIGGGSVNREDTFAVALSNYFGDLNVRKTYPDLRAKFLKVAKDPRHWVTQARPSGSRAGSHAASVPSSSLTDGAPSALVSSRSASSSMPAQRAPAHPASGTTNARPADHAPEVAPPEAGIDKSGFIDNSKGAPIYTAPAEAGGVRVRDTPLPPATRVFASGTHPKWKHWWYVTAYLDQTMLRGYVESFRVNVDLPEPLAELRQLDGGETAEGLAKETFGGAVRDGHDLRYYENVLLYVNRGRVGIGGSYQDPGVLGDGSNNIKLYAGHRIWLVSPEYAKALESEVPSGSLTGGAVAKATRFAGHLQDILQSVTESRHHFGEAAGEFAQAIRDHLPEVIGITAGFLMAESASMFLAATPTGVSQAAAVVIQLALTAFGAAGMVQAGIEALKHGSAWLTTAWTAYGKPELIVEASKEFLRMLVAVAVAALSDVGAKANYGNALKIANNMPTGGLPALATVGGPAIGGARPMTGVPIGPSVGGTGVVGNAAARLTEKEKAALGEGPDIDRLHDKDVGEARAQERHDSRAAERRKSSADTEGDSVAKETEGTESRRRPPRAGKETRTDLAKHVPPPGDVFSEWFDSLSLRELDELLADESRDRLTGAAEVIGDNIRHPRGKHEWLMVAEARRLKQWGVSMKTIQDGRTFTDTTIGKRFRHGAAGSGTMHRDLRGMIQSSNSYAEFIEKLNQWADRELSPSHSARWPHETPRGRYSLPDNLQVRYY